MSNVSEQMRSDWNERAREDAHYYVAFGARHQDEDEFLATATEVVAAIDWELKRFPAKANRRARRALEIGCGPGRLMKPLSSRFGEIHGVDVSDEMVRIARERLAGIPHAHAHATNGSSLALFADESFDLVYSYAVFQHIPSREVVLEYMAEIRRVLKPGGVFRGQLSGLPPSAQPNTWSGVSFSAEEIHEFTRTHQLQLLALEGVETQYMWTTWRKPAPGQPATPEPASIRRITNASSSETVVPSRGPLAAVSVWVLHLPPLADLNTLEALIDGRPGSVAYIGPEDPSGLRQVNVMLPAGVRTGLVPVELRYHGAGLCPPAHIRVTPAGPLVPRVIRVTDGINIVSENRTSSGTFKIQLDEIAYPDQISLDLSGQAVPKFDLFRTDPLPPRYEVNLTVPDGLMPGVYDLNIKIGRRALMPRRVEIAPLT